MHASVVLLFAYHLGAIVGMWQFVAAIRTHPPQFAAVPTTATNPFRERPRDKPSRPDLDSLCHETLRQLQLYAVAITDGSHHPQIIPKLTSSSQPITAQTIVSTRLYAGNILHLQCARLPFVPLSAVPHCLILLYI